jgi:pyridoxamine 5'-phosphate oxidase
MAADPLSDAGAPDFSDPLGMLAACHRRLERQLAMLDRLQRHLPEFGSDTEARAAARAILKYFDNAAPSHHADEEASLFPRLVALAPPQVELAIAELENDHLELNRGWRRLRPQLAGIVAGVRSNLSPAEVERMSVAYGRHIEREERDVFPLAVRVLDGQALAAIGREMATRRGVDAEALPRRR